ncbi:MAG: hypothetical protein ACFFCP_05570 [Promethearchaeota archaeon]
MAKIRASYWISLNKQEEILNALEESFGLRGTIDEDYISMRGRRESGIEAVRLSIEKDVIKVLVVIEDASLLESFNSILGEPKKVKGRIL